MADFRTHVTFSSAIGAGYAVVASGLGFDLSTSLVAGALCGVSGMLPDIDSESGVPRREALGFAAAIVPMLLADRLRAGGMSHDQIVLTAGVLYVLIRFVGVELLSRWTVHRGMWHSIPAVLIFAGLAYLVSAPTNVFDRYLKALAVGLGALSHLVLDEVYSVDTRGVVPRLKKSFGTAVKLWGKDPRANLSAYAKLAAVATAISMEPMFMERLEQRRPELAARARDAAEGVQSLRDRVAQRLEAATGEATGWVDSSPTLGVPAPAAPRWFAPPGATGGAWGPNRSDSAAEPGAFQR